MKKKYITNIQFFPYPGSRLCKSGKYIPLFDFECGWAHIIVLRSGDCRVITCVIHISISCYYTPIIVFLLKSVAGLQMQLECRVGTMNTGWKQFSIITHIFCFPCIWNVLFRVRVYVCERWLRAAFPQSWSGHTATEPAKTPYRSRLVSPCQSMQVTRRNVSPL